MGAPSSAHAPTECMPGDDVTNFIRINNATDNVTLGSGLRSSESRIFATMAGIIRSRTGGHYWIEGFCRNTQYYPKIGDQVVGIIEFRGGEWYKVNMMSGCAALLNRLSFEGASKRNKPELERGDVIYARVAVANKDEDIELTCISSSGVKKDWSSGETIYGQLTEGLVLRVTIQQTRAMLRPDCVLLSALGKHVAFEITVGMNGMVWIKAGNVIDTIVIRNAIANAAFLDDAHTEAMVEQLVRRARRNPSS